MITSKRAQRKKKKRLTSTHKKQKKTHALRYHRRISYLQLCPDQRHWGKYYTCGLSKSTGSRSRLARPPWPTNSLCKNSAMPRTSLQAHSLILEQTPLKKEQRHQVSCLTGKGRHLLLTSTMSIRDLGIIWAPATRLNKGLAHAQNALTAPAHLR